MGKQLEGFCLCCAAHVSIAWHSRDDPIMGQVQWKKGRSAGNEGTMGQRNLNLSLRTLQWVELYQPPQKDMSKGYPWTLRP